jgi:hypothetical protein
LDVVGVVDWSFGAGRRNDLAGCLPYDRPGMERTRVGLVVVAALALAGCGGADMTDGPSPTNTASGSGAPVSPLTITRTGGIAGVNDVLEVAADGTAQLTRRSGQTSACTPSPTALDQLRAIDLALVGSGPPKAPIADGFSYTVVVGTVTASAGDGEEGIRGAFVTAASAVLASCEAMLVGSDAPYQ